MKILVRAIAHKFTKPVFLISLLAFFFSLIISEMSVTKPRLVFNLASSTSGASIIFPEHGQLQQEIKPGNNSVNLTVAQWDKPFRWDPMHGSECVFVAEKFTIRCLLFSYTPSLDDIIPLNHIESISIKNGTLTITTAKAAALAHPIDPQVSVGVRPTISWWRWMQIIPFAVAMATFTWMIGAWFLRAAPSPTMRYVVLGGIVLLGLSCIIMVRIPAGYGSGWDGENYLSLAVQVAHGTFPADRNLYYYLRLLSFPFPMISSHIDPAITSLVQTQALQNFVIISTSLLLLAATFVNLQIPSRSAVGLLISSILSWWFLILPGFYPVLSDHMALFIVTLSLFIWSRSSGIWILLLLACISVGVHPLLFIVPSVLYIYHPDSTPLSKKLEAPFFHWIMILATAIGIGVGTLVLCLLLGIPETALLDRQGGGRLSPAIIEYRYFSIGISVLLIAGVTIAATVVFSKIHHQVTWRQLSRAIIAVTVVTGTYLAIISLVPHRSLSTPPLLNNILIQAQGAPFKQIVAHTAYFGPVFLLALTCLIARQSTNHRNLQILLLCSIPTLALMSLGSESRQFAFILPALFAMIGLSVNERSPWIRLALFQLFVLAPALSLPHAMETTRLEADFLSTEWQVYFGRQGPWMGIPAYLYFLGISLVFATTLLPMFFRHRHPNA